jgi:hypothetical protein
MVDWHKYAFADQPDLREGGKITNRDIYGMPSSVAGNEAARRLKKKGDEKRAKESATASKKELNNNTKAKETAERVTRRGPGSDLLKKIEQLGAAAINTMPITQLQSLLERKKDGYNTR